MHVWRFPIIYFAWLAGASALTAILMALIAARRRAVQPIFRGLFTGASVTALLAVPPFVHVLTEREFTLLSKHGVYPHYAWWAFTLPIFVAAGLVLGAHLLFPAQSVTQSLKWRLYFLGTCFGFAALNLANWCSPGWCERFGFPFPYSWWSDAIINMNGKNLTAGASGLGAAANVAILACVVIVMVRSSRRAAAIAQAPPNSA